ncbi:hypothetical protein [Caballeronia sp. J97]|uniref:hypothetical protein n=1 Tax=Caballeronia sp. J97 TaxID=2805429 RepID=UPI002AB31193|nr:hypothetical protein [Caballeronia sp. J97]
MLYSNLYVDEPLERIADDWNYLHDKVIKQFFGFKEVGDNVVGIRSVENKKISDLGINKTTPIALVETRKNFEIGPNGVLEVPRHPFSIHVTRAGTPHHAQHVFGYWHINDKDEIVLTLPPDDAQPGRVIIVMGKPKGRETDRFAWYCEKCVTLLFMRELRSGEDFRKFWAAEVAAVREYNSNPKNQLCPDCGHNNPLGYSAMQPVDKPEERAARLQW